MASRLMAHEAREKAKEKVVLEKLKKETKAKKVKKLRQEVQTEVARAQFEPTPMDETLPIKKRGLYERDADGNLVLKKKVARLEAIDGPVTLGARSLQPNAPVDMPPPIDEAVWIKFFSLVSFHAGNVRRACLEMKIPRTEVWRKEQEDPAFKLRLIQAKEMGCDALEEEAIRRAYEGVEEPVGFYQGTSSETKTVYSDTLMMFMLKSLRPDKYADRSRNENINLNVEATAEELKTARQTIMNKLAGVVAPDPLNEEPKDVTPVPPEEDLPIEATVDLPGDPEEETPRAVTQWEVD